MAKAAGSPRLINWNCIGSFSANTVSRLDRRGGQPPRCRHGDTFRRVDPDLKKELALNDGVVTAVADDTLRTYDQGSDRMRGDILEVQTVPAVPGSSGMRIKFKPVTLLEGFRPKRIVRLFSVKWRVDDLPREERLYDALPPASFEPPQLSGAADSVAPPTLALPVGIFDRRDGCAPTENLNPPN